MSLIVAAPRAAPAQTRLARPASTLRGLRDLWRRSVRTVTGLFATDDGVLRLELVSKVMKRTC
jgi:hypothetical protein